MIKSGHLRTPTAALLFSAGLASSAAPAWAQRLGQATGAETPLWRVAAALLLCLALAVGGALALRIRLRGLARPPGASKWWLLLPSPSRFLGAGQRRLQLVETLRLSHQVDICLFSCDERHFIVAATPQGVTDLTAGAGVTGAPP